MLPWQREKGSLGNLFLRKERRTWERFNAMDVKNMGITREIVLSLRTIKKGEEKKPTSPKRWRKLKRRSPRKRKYKISTMIEIVFLT